jgi:hypothetical protein
MGGRGFWMVAVGALAVTACGGSEKQGQVRQTAHVAPTFVPGNPTCPAGTSSLKIEPVEAGTYSDDGFSVTIEIAADGTLSFVATQGVDQVIVKGGPNANVYTYDPEATEDSGLITPTNPNNNQPYGYSHVDFCYDEDEVVLLPLEVDKTATSVQRTGWTWEIDKDGACPTLTPGSTKGSWDLAFRADLTATAGASDWLTTGTITIRNPNDVGEDATIESVEDLLDGVGVDVDCGAVTFPATLAGGATIVCTYEATTAEAPESNTATVTTSGDIEGNSDTVAVTIGPADVENDCVTVSDQFESEDPVVLGEVCIDDLDANGAYRFEYLTGISWEACGTWQFTNTASFVTNDSRATGSDSFVTTLDVACEEPAYPQEPMLLSANGRVCQFKD